MTTTLHLLGLTRAALADWLEACGEKPSHAERIFRNLYKHRITALEEIPGLPSSLRKRLQEACSLQPLAVERVVDSHDGTRKILFRLDDGARIETVCIPSGSRLTLCISSQVGCALGCRFCYTASMGPGRNLSVAEYIGQFMGAMQLITTPVRAVNVVFMGMGEPLVNLDNLLSTLTILTDHLGPQLGARRITVSTAGLCPQILTLGRAFPVRLALSLHATTDEVRSALMPINRRYNLQALLDTLHTFQQLPGQQDVGIVFEYTLIRDVNDSPDDARRLCDWIQPLRSKVNLIPYNEHPGAPYRCPEDQRVRRFAKVLHERGVRVTQRKTRGGDIFAACGQLALETPELAEFPA